MRLSKAWNVFIISLKLIYQRCIYQPVRYWIFTQGILLTRNSRGERVFKPKSNSFLKEDGRWSFMFALHANKTQPLSIFIMTCVIRSSSHSMTMPFRFLTVPDKGHHVKKNETQCWQNCKHWFSYSLMDCLKICRCARATSSLSYSSTALLPTEKLCA
jgi:hypothetical protein